MKKIIFFVLSLTSLSISAQNIGIGTTTPQATLDVKGNQRIGGASNYMTFDSLSAKIEWKNAFLYAPVSQALMKHSAAADGLFYNNIGGIGKIEYRNASGNPVFYTSFVSGDGYFSNRLGIGNLPSSPPVRITPVTTFVSSGLSSFTLVNNGDQQTITSVTVTVTQNSYIEVSGILGIYSGGCFGCGDPSVYLLLNDPSQSYEAIVCANPHVIGVTTLSFLHRTIFPLSAGNYVFTFKVKKINGPTITDATGYTGTYEIPGERLTAKVIPF